MRLMIDSRLSYSPLTIDLEWFEIWIGREREKKKENEWKKIMSVKIDFRKMIQFDDSFNFFRVWNVSNDDAYVFESNLIELN